MIMAGIPCRVVPSTMTLLRIHARLASTAAKKLPRFSVKPASDPSVIALRHMDNFYKDIFSPKLWRSIRIALHAPRKQVALLNNFATNRDEAAERLMADGCVKLEDIVKFSLSPVGQKVKKNWEEGKSQVGTSDAQGLKQGEEERKMVEDIQDEEDARWRTIMPEMGSLSSSLLMQFVPATELKTAEEKEVNEEDYFKAYPADVAIAESLPLEKLRELPHFSVYARTRGDVMPLPGASIDACGVRSHILMDAADTLAVKALEINPGDRVLYIADLEEPSSLLPVIQSLLAGSLTVFTSTPKRAKQINQFLSLYLPTFDGIDIVDADLSLLDSLGKFHQVVVEPNCTLDRRCMVDNEDNFFHVSRVPERVNLPHVQAEFLHAGLNALDQEGRLVYVTSSLSPVQNDGVILSTLQRLEEEGAAQNFRIRDMRPALNCYHGVFQMVPSENQLGIVVIPYLPNNYGPKYLARIDKI